MWIVGRFVAETPQGMVWDFQGAFADRDGAVAACDDATFFIGPCVVGQKLPRDTTEWPGAEYPLA